jgi:hypothetical protein
VITEPGDETAAGASGSLPECHADHEHRDRVIRTLKAALVQGRLTEDEYDSRAAQASASSSHAELAALTADLPVDRIDAPARPPMANDVRAGVCVIIAAASVVTGILLWQPDNGLAFMTFIVAAVTLLVTPIVTVGLIFDVRHQKRSGGQPKAARDGWPKLTKLRFPCITPVGRCRDGRAWR